MRKKIFIFGIIVIFLLSFYTMAFSISEVGKNHIDIQEVDYKKEEIFVEGSILKIDYKSNEIIIDQYMDDNSIEISPILKIRKDVVFVLQRNDKVLNIDFKDLRIGDRCGIVLDKDRTVRGLIIFV